MNGFTFAPSDSQTLPAGVQEFAEDIAEFGVTVREGVLPEGWWGSYDHRQHEIILLPDLGTGQLRSTLAHELGHAYYRHKGNTELGEEQARAWAAQRLIESDTFSEAAKAGNWAGMVAKRLGVMPSDAVWFLRSMSDDEWLAIREMLDMEPRGFGE